MFVLLAAAAVFGVLRLSASHPAASFDLHELGKRQTAAPTIDSGFANERVGDRGYVMSMSGASLSLAAVASGTTAWKDYQHGVTRSTPFGHETITLAPGRAEQLSVVDRHLGTRTWTWSLGTKNLDPSLRSDGSVLLEEPNTIGGLRILPVKIFDAAGHDITPAGARWSLVRGANGWLLELRLNDATLPVPYVIDPSVAISGSPYGSSLASGAIANYSFSIKTNGSGSGPLVSGSTITTTFAGTGVAASSSINLTGTVWNTDHCAGSGSVTGSTATVITLADSGGTCSIPQGTSGLAYTILGVKNTTATPGAHNGTIKTSIDSSGATFGVTTVAAVAVSGVSFTGQPQTAGALADWQVGFTTSTTNGALVGGSTISVAFPSAFPVPGTLTATPGTGFTNCSLGVGHAGGGTSALTVTITLSDASGAGSCTVPANTAAQLTINGLTNPAAAGYAGTAFTVKTSSDSSATAASASGTVTVGTATSVGGISFSGAKQTAGATNDTWTVGFTTSNTPGNTMYAGWNVTSVFPSAFGTGIPASPTVTLTGAGYSNCTATGATYSSSTGTLVFTLAGASCSISPNTSGAFTVSGVTDPSAQPLTAANFTVTTSADTVAASPDSNVQIYAADGSGTASINPTSATAGSTGNTEILTYTVGTGGSAAGGAITVAVPSGWSAPSTTSTDPGYVQANVAGAGYSTSGVSVSTQTITVTTSSVLNPGDTILVRYGDTSGGGPGATANTTAGPQTWTVQEESTSGGTLTTISAGGGSPSVTIGAAALDHFVVSLAGSQTDGVAFTGTNTVTAKDQYGNTITNFDASAPGNAVTIAASPSGVVSGLSGGAVLNQAGDFSSGIANLTGDLVYTGATGSNITFTASANGKTGTSGNVSISAGPANASESTVSANPTAVVADGSATTTITVTLVDVGGNPVSGKTVTLTHALSGSGSDHSSVSSASGPSNSSGVVTFTASDTTAESVVYSAHDTTDSVDVTQTTAPVVFSSISASNSSVGANPTSVTADGTSTSTITVTAKDGNNNPVVGKTVTLSQALVGGGTSDSFISPASAGSNVTDSNGLATFSVTDTTAEAVRYTASALGVTITQTADVTFTPGAANAAQSTLTPTSPSITADGSSTQTLTVQAKDANGNNENSGGLTVTITEQSGTGSISGVTDHGNGSYTATVMSPTTAGSGVFVATLGGNPVESGNASQTQATVTYTPGAASAAQSTLSPTGPSITADGSSTQVLTVQAKDANDNNESLGGLTVTITKQSGTGSISGVTDNGNGSYTATVMSPTTAGSGVFVATLGGNPVESGNASQTQATVTYTPGPTTALHVSTSAGTPQTAGFPFDVTVTAVDQFGNTTPSYTGTVKITSSDGQAVLPSGNYTFVSGDNGVHTFSSGVTLETAGSQTVTATDQPNTSIHGTANITVGPNSDSASSSTVTRASPTTSTDSPNTNTITVTVKDDYGNVIPNATVVLLQTIGATTTQVGTSQDTNGSGVTQFTVSHTVAEGVVYSATADGTLIDETAGVTYTTGAPYALAFLVQPTNVGANQTIIPFPEVEILDAQGNLTSSTANVTLAVHAGSPGSLGGTLTQPAVAGVATFNDLSVDTVGNDYALDATSSGLSGATSNSFNGLEAPGLAFSNTTTNMTYYPTSTRTIYFRPGTNGTFTVTATPTGQQTYNFPTLTGWTGGGSGSSNSATYTLNGDTNGSTGNQVTYYDGTSTSGATTFDVVKDSLPPTGGAVTIPSATDSTGSFDVTVTYATDAGSGIQGTESLQRYKETLSNSTCSGGFVADGAPVAISGTGAQSQNSLAAGCYMWRLTATDNVGNVSSFDSGTMTVDPTPPSAPTLVSISPVGTGLYYSGSGSTVFVKPNSDDTNSFTVTASSTDDESGVASYSFPAIPGFTQSPVADHPEEMTYVAAGPSTDDGGSGFVTATNGVGSTSSNGFTLTVTVDGTPPASTGFGSPSADVYSTDGKATVNWGAFSDGGSGMSTLTITRQIATLSNDVCGSFGVDNTFSQTLTTASTSIPQEMGLIGGNCYRYVLTATDHIGNPTTFTSSNVMVDLTPPVTPTLTSITPTGSNLYVNGSTVYFKPGAGTTGQTFTVTAASAGDPETGLKTGSWIFPTITGFGAPSISGSQATYTASSPTVSGAGYATVENNALETSAQGSAFTVVADSTAATGGSFVGVPEYSSSTTVSFSTTLFTDGGSGVASQTLQRQVASPSAGACPSSGWANDGAAVAATTSFTASGLTSGDCYRWLFSATDNVGNVSTTVLSADGTGGVYGTLVDSSAPGAPSFGVSGSANVYFDGTTVFFDPATTGSFTVTATSSAPPSGIKNYTFPTLPGFTGGGTTTSNQMTYTFGLTATDESGNVKSTSNAGVDSPTSLLQTVIDTTGPSAPTIACSPSCASNSSVNVTLTQNGDGSGSGFASIHYTTNGDTPTAASTLYTGPVSVGSTETIKAVAIDNLGNVGTVATQTVTIDSTPPTAASADVTGTTMNVHFDKQLANVTPAASAFAVTYTHNNGSPTPDTVTNVAISGSTAVLTLTTAITNDQTATVSYTQPGANQLQDLFGNLAASFGPLTITLDTTPPVILTTTAAGTQATIQFDEPLDSTSTPAASAFTVALNPSSGPSVSDPVTSVSPIAPGDSKITLNLQDTVSGYATATLVYTEPGTGRIRDLAGNEEASFSKSITLDITPPHATDAEVNASSLTVNFDEALGDSTHQSEVAGSAFAVSLGGLPVTVTNVAVTDGGAGVTLTLSAAAIGGQSVTVTYTQPGSNPRFQDAAGNATPTFTLSATNLTSGGGSVVPTFVSATPADGSSQPSITGPILLHANEYVAWSNLTLSFMDLVGGPATTTPLSGGTTQDLSVPFTTTTQGLYAISGTISDGANSTTFTTHFTVWTQNANATAPPSAKTADPGVSGSLTTSDNSETVTWPASDVPTTPGDGLIMQMTPQSSTQAPAPAGTTWSAGGAPVSITANTILGDTPVKTFSAPLVIAFPNAQPSDLPLVSSDGGVTWRYLLPCDPTDQIPSGMTDCFAWDSGVLDVYTLHLTLFGFGVDHMPPSIPSLSGNISGGQLALRWTRSTDNSGAIEYYSIWENGQVIKVFEGQTFEYYPGSNVNGDTNVYTVQALDFSDNGSAQSNAVTGVPSLAGLTEQQARAALNAEGFTVGTVTNAGGGGSVVSQNPAAPAYATVGSPIDFTVAGPVRTPLSFSLVGSKRINTMTRNYAAVRVQLNLSATIVATLAMNHQTVATWTRNVKAGTWILRYTLPKRLPSGQYKLTVAATTAGQRRAATILVRIKHGQILLGGSAKVLIVGSGTLDLKVPKAKVQVTSVGNVFQTTFWSRNVAVVVVDIDTQGLAMVHNLHTVFPQVKIVAVTKNPNKLTKARRFGASAVVLAGSDTSQIVSATVSSLLARV